MRRSGKAFSRLTRRERLVAVLFIMFAVCILAISITFFALSAGRSYMGVILSMGGKGWAVESVEPNGLASKAGIKSGDRPVEINGQPAEIFLAGYKEAGVVFGYRVREMTVLDSRGQLKLVASQDSPPVRQLPTQLVTFFVAAVIFWMIGFYVLFKRPDKLAALLLCLSGLTIGLILSAKMAADRAVPTALYFHIVASVIGPWLLLHFFHVLPEESASLRNKPKIFLIYLVPAATLVLFPLVGIAEGQPVGWFRATRMIEYGVGFIGAAGVAFFRYFHAVSAKTRQQLKMVMIGCLAAIIPILIFNLLPVMIWKRAIIPGDFSILFIGFVPLSMGYAVVTQKLMDIDVIIRRGIIYGLITAVMAAILSVAIFLVLAFRRSLGVPEEILVALVLSSIASILFGPTKKGAEILVDKLFYKDRYDYRRIINSLSMSLNKVREFMDMSRLIVGTTVNTLNLAGGCLFVRTQAGNLEIAAAQGTFADIGKQSQFSALISRRTPQIDFPNSASSAYTDLAFLVPLVAAEKEVGILCLSQKVSRQDFSSDDIYLLQGLTSVASMALHSASLIRDVSARDTFVSIASHELRTPLTSIMGYAELLQQRNPSDATRKKWLKHIVDSVQRLSAMADDLLNVTRIQSGKVTLKLETVQVSDVFEERLSIARESTDKHEFIMDIEPGIPDAFIDRDKFTQIIGNLLSNAVKYSPAGGRITLSARHDPSRHHIVISVSDEGIGIAPADTDSLFKTFHRIQRPETRGVGGSGLGLYIVKEWTESMGGKVWLESELNKGSTFFVAVSAQNSKVKKIPASKNGET